MAQIERKWSEESIDATVKASSKADEKVWMSKEEEDVLSTELSMWLRDNNLVSLSKCFAQLAINDLETVMFLKEERNKPPEQQDDELNSIIEGIKFGERIAFKNKVKLLDESVVEHYVCLAAQEKAIQMQIDALEARVK